MLKHTFVVSGDFPREVEVRCTWRDGDGNELWYERWTPGREATGRMELQRTLPEGRFQVELRCASGQRGTASVTVSLANPRPAPVELVMR